MSGIARILLDRGGLVSGSDAKESRGVAGAAGPRRADPHRPRRVVARPAARRADRGGHHARRDPQDQPRTGRGAPPRHPGDPAAGGAGQADGRAHHADGDRHRTARRRPPRCSSWRCSTADSTRRSRSAATSARRAPTPTTAAATASSPRPTRATGRCCEYTPDVAVVTNIEADHLDFFGSAEAYVAVFDDFVERLRPGGALVVCVDDPGAAALAERTAALGIRVLRYGSGDDPNLAGALLNWEQQGTGAVAHDPAGGRVAAAGDAAGGARQAHGAQRAGRAAGGDRGRRGPSTSCSTAWPGSRVCGAGSSWSAPPTGVRVFDDYAHHPTEVRADLTARARAWRGASGRVDRGVPAASVFADRGFRARVRAGADAADEVFVLDVYAAREQPIAGVSGASVAEHVSVPVTLRPGLLGGRRAGRRGGRGRATSWSRWARATSRCSARRSWRRCRRKANRSAPGRPGRCRDDRADRRRRPAEAPEPEAGAAADAAETAGRRRRRRRPTTSRGRGAGRGASARSGAPPRPGRPPSRRPAARPSAASWASRRSSRKPLGARA